MIREKLAETSAKLEEDIIVPTRRKVFEGGGLSMERKPIAAPTTKARSATPKVRATPINPTGRCLGCGCVVSYNKGLCYACVTQATAAAAAVEGGA